MKFIKTHMKFFFSILFFIIYMFVNHLCTVHGETTPTDMWALILAPVDSGKKDTDNETKSADPIKKQPITEDYSANYFLSEEELLGKISDNLKEKFHLDGKLEVRFFRPLHISPLPDKSWAIKFIDLPTALSNRMLVSFKILCQGKVVITVAKLPIQCDVYKTVWMSQTALSANTLLNKKDFFTTTVNVLTFKDLPIPEDTPLENFLLKRAIRPNEVLTFAHVESAPLIRKGQTLEVLAEKGLLILKLKAVALENGSLGQIISIKNLDSQKTFQGKVLNDGTVQITL